MSRAQEVADDLDNPAATPEPSPSRKNLEARVWILTVCTKLMSRITGELLQGKRLEKTDRTLHFACAEMVRILEHQTDNSLITQRIWDAYGRWFPEEIVTRAQWDAVRKYVAPAVFRRDGKKCVYCGSERDITVDHVVPIARGGSHEMGNLAACCAECNSSKGDKTVEEWKGR